MNKLAKFGIIAVNNWFANSASWMNKLTISFSLSSSPNSSTSSELDFLYSAIRYVNNSFNMNLCCQDVVN